MSKIAVQCVISKARVFRVAPMCGSALMICGLLLGLSQFSCGSEKEKPNAAYAVVQNFPLRQDLNGIEGTLQLRIDSRLTKSVRDELWGKGDWSFVLAPGSELSEDFSKVLPEKARLDIVSNKGRVILDRQLETSLAQLEAWGGETFLLTEDHSAGLGSYNGLGSTILDISAGTIHTVAALDTKSHRKETVRLLRSLKSTWEVVQDNGQPEILAVSCHPKESGQFVIDYIRYTVDGGYWVEYKRQADGVWESDQPFPERSAFP